MPPTAKAKNVSIGNKLGQVQYWLYSASSSIFVREVEAHQFGSLIAATEEQPRTKNEEQQSKKFIQTRS